MRGPLCMRPRACSEMEMTKENNENSRFNCPACGVALIWRAKACTGCKETAPIYNHPAFWAGLAIFGVVSLGLILWVILN